MLELKTRTQSKSAPRKKKRQKRALLRLLGMKVRKMGRQMAKRSLDAHTSSERLDHLKNEHYARYLFSMRGFL